MIGVTIVSVKFCSDFGNAAAIVNRNSFRREKYITPDFGAVAISQFKFQLL
jgi:hypothetical protein